MSNKTKFTAESNGNKVELSVDSDDSDIELFLQGENISQMMYDFNFPECCSSLIMSIGGLRRPTGRKLNIDFPHTNRLYTLSIDGECIRIYKNNRNKRNDYITIRDWRDPDKISLNKE